MWVVSGGECYAQNAANIIRAWSTTNQTLQGRNAPLVRHTCTKAVNSSTGAAMHGCMMMSTSPALMHTPPALSLSSHHVIIVVVVKLAVSGSCVLQSAVLPHLGTDLEDWWAQ
jgi:hypothetical protein